jgi:stage IV sporulation protein B
VKTRKCAFILSFALFIALISINSIKLVGVHDESKIAAANVSPEIKVVPSGLPIGVRLNVDGVFVVGFSDIETNSRKKQSPAVINGVEIGDCIIEADGQKLESSGQLSNIVNKSKGEKINFKIKRKNKIIIISFKPLQEVINNEYKIGLWIRDSTAGIGTMTFYDPASGKFGALGHPINDIDTGKLLPIKDGKIYSAKILSIDYGERGKPGELKGMFSDEDDIGILQMNTTEGIYGKMNRAYLHNNTNLKSIPVAKQKEIKEGPATILVALNGTNVKEYNINIERVNYQSKPNSKSLIIKVTDKELLQNTGGIVQGMSGSPIIQNNKIIGAVTHVFVNRPEMGYGIYIEWMLKEIE